MKGVSNAVIFDKANTSPAEATKMYQIIKSVNFERNVLMTTGRSFGIDELAKILCYQNDKFSILYNKYFYGFEKEGKSKYLDYNQVEGVYFNYRYPFKDTMVGSTLTKAINLPLMEDDIINLVRDKSNLLISKEEIELEEEKKKLAEMDDL